MNTEYLDPVTGERAPLDTPKWRGSSGAPLVLTAGPGLTRDDIDEGAPGLWRYRSAFALAVEHPIVLGEGRTPLLTRSWGGSHELSCAETLFKLEWFSPTGSFKDRGAAVMLSMLREQGVRRILEDSSGNGGAAIAAYGAAGGIDVDVFAPASTSPAKLVQARAYGATIHLIDGPREASQEAAIAAANAGEGFYASHAWQPFFLEGTKTLAYEIWEDLGFTAPDSIVLPVGAGTSLLGLSIGFDELKRAGQITKLPRLYAAQPLHCSPIDAAFTGDRTREVLPTIAEGTAIRTPMRLTQIVAALAASGGGSVAVSEHEIEVALRQLASDGLFAEPTSAVAAAGLTKLRAAGTIRPGECTVVLLTGSGLKASSKIGELLLDSSIR